MDLSEYLHCTGETPDFDDFLLSGPEFSDTFARELEKSRDELRQDPGWDIDFPLDE